MDEGTLGVHEIELVVDSAEDFSNGCGVGQHAHCTLDLGEVTSWDDGGGLVVDSTLESSGTPVDELDGSLGLDDSNGGVDILGDNISSVHETASHVLSVTGVALGHHVGGLEDGVGDLSNGELLVVGLLGRDHGCIRAQHEVNSGVGHQVSLELSDIDVQGTIETERGGQGRNHLSDQSVKVGVGGSIDVQGSLADIVDGLIVEHESDISVLQQGVGGEHRVVGLNDSGGDLGGGVDTEIELALLSVVNRESLEEEGSETRSCTSTNRVEDEETLETSTLVSQLPDSVKAEVHNLLTNGVMTTGIVVSGILLASDELFYNERSIST